MCRYRYCYTPQDLLGGYKLRQRRCFLQNVAFRLCRISRILRETTRLRETCSRRFIIDIYSGTSLKVTDDDIVHSKETQQR